MFDLSILNYGWASTYNDGAGVTGGQGGTVHEFNEASTFNGQTGFNALWEFMKGDNLLTPMILIWTGGNIVLPFVDYRIDTGSLSAKTGGPENKTIYANIGQTVEGPTFRMIGWENIIWLNWKRKNIPVKTAPDTPNNGDGWSIIGSRGIIIAYCDMNGEFSIHGEVGTGGSNLGIGDGGIDADREADLCSYVNCYFQDIVRGGLIVGSDSLIGNRGKARISVVNCRFRQVHIRQLYARFGKVHFIQTLHHYDPPFNNLSNQYPWNGVGEPAFEVQMLYERCYVDTHRYCWRDKDTAGVFPVISGLKTIDCYIGPQWAGESSDRWNNTKNDIRPLNVTFEPWNTVGYLYPPVRTPQQSRDYAIEWAGAVYHLLDTPLDEFTLTLTTTTGGTATRNPASGTIEQNATVILTATPSSGFNFSRWENLLTGQTLSTSTTYNHVMTADISIVAVFVSDVPIPPGETIRFCRVNELIV